jgi:flagellar basal-body rod modification protein FlgD
MSVSAASSSYQSDLQKGLLGATTPTKREVSYDFSGGTKEISEGDFKFSSEAQKTLGKDDFLKLLTTQLKYQDPLQPQDNQQFIGQMAQFSSLETSKNMEKSMTAMSDKLVSYMDSQMSAGNNAGSASNLIGKTVQVEQTSFTVDGTASKLNIHVDNPIDTYLTLVDDKGNIVSRQTFVSLDKANKDFKDIEWDGKDENGKEVPPGKYTIKVLDSSGVNDHGYVFQQNTVTGIKYTEKGAEMTIGGKGYTLSQIKQIEAASTQSGTQK